MQLALLATALGSYTQEEAWSRLHLIPGNGPYIPQRGFGIDRDAPAGCEVTQVNLFSRHGERYFDAYSADATIEDLKRLTHLNQTLTGPLAYLNDYDWDTLDTSKFDAETHKGPFAGLGDALRHGEQFRVRYDHLVDENVTFYAASEQRVVDTAKYFAQGFLGEIPKNSSFVVIADDDPDNGANSLTPMNGCNTFSYDGLPESDYQELEDTLFGRASERLSTADFNLTVDEVKGLIQLCGYQLNINGDTALCDLFTNDELLGYSYTVDLYNYYVVAAGNNASRYIGSAYVDALIRLVEDDSMNMTLSFSHDWDMMQIVDLLGLYESKPLSKDRVDFWSPWKSSNIAPMGARLVTERLECEGYDEPLVRFIHNDAVIPVDVADGPGYSIGIEDFKDWIHERLNGSDYASWCQVDTDVPSELTFFWD